MRQRRRNTFIASSLALILVVVGCGSDGEQSEGGEERRDPKLAIDERNGTVDRVGLGDRGARVERVFGEAPPYNQVTDITPLGVNSFDLTFPGARHDPPGREHAFRYRGVSFFAVADEVRELTVTSERGRTNRGLQPGDQLDRAEELYPELECGETNVGSDAPIFEPACWGRTGKGVYMWVGGDPINNVGLLDGPIGPRR